MAGLQAGSTNFKSVVSHVEGSTKKLLQAYGSSHNVSSETIAQLNKVILQKAEEAYRIASMPNDDIAKTVQSEFVSYLASHGLVVQKKVVQQPTLPLVKNTPSREITPRVTKKASPPVEAYAQKRKTRTPVAHTLPVAPATPQVMQRGRPRKMRPMFNGHELPRGLRSPEEALTMKFITCFEDGKKVKDLASHLRSLNITPTEYRSKWGLADSYPMHAPQVILQRGVTYDVDYVTGVRRRVRK